MNGDNKNYCKNSHVFLNIPLKLNSFGSETPDQTNPTKTAEKVKGGQKSWQVNARHERHTNKADLFTTLHSYVHKSKIININNYHGT